PTHIPIHIPTHIPIHIPTHTHAFSFISPRCRHRTLAGLSHFSTLMPSRMVPRYADSFVAVRRAFGCIITADVRLLAWTVVGMGMGVGRTNGERNIANAHGDDDHDGGLLRESAEWVCVRRVPGTVGTRITHRVRDCV